MRAGAPVGTVAAAKWPCHISGMTQADLEAPRSAKLGAVALVALIHVAVILALIRAFAPDFTGKVAERVLAVFTVTITTPPPSPAPTPRARASQGAAAAAGKKARPREVVAPHPKVVIARTIAPRAAGNGNADAAGAGESGAGTGAGGQGNGTGSGNGGNGQGGGLAAKPVKIAGDINSTRDYPSDSRSARLGHDVIVYMTVGTDGRAHGCRVQKPSPDPGADAITCRLAEQRFRFKPGTDASGNPVDWPYGWRQRWFLPGGAQ